MSNSIVRVMTKEYRRSNQREIVVANREKHVPGSILPVVIEEKIIIFFSQNIIQIKHDLRCLARRKRWRLDWISKQFNPRAHYHSTSYEAIVVIRGEGVLQIGDKKPILKHVRGGDLILIPAGVPHRGVSHSKDFLIAGIYPSGCQWDMIYCEEEKLREAKRNIKQLPVPSRSPLFGYDQESFRLWWGNNKKTN